MAVKIYNAGGAVNIEGVNPDILAINAAQFDWQKIGNTFYVRDNIERQTYNLGLVGNIQDATGTPYADEAALISALNGFTSAQFTEILNNPSFLMLGSLGKIEGVEPVSKFGENPDIDTGSAPADMWSYGGLYTFSDTNDSDTISSSNTGDTGIEITITGLDIDYNEVTQTATLNGQNKVTLTTPLLRCYRAYNSNGTPLQGDVYIYVDSAITNGVPDVDNTVRAKIDVGAEQTLMMIYTVPAGKTLVYTEGYIALSRQAATNTVVSLMARLKDKVFRVKRRVALNSQGTGTWRAVYSVARLAPEKTDIVFRIDSVTSNNTGVSGGFEGFLFDNEIWNL